MVVRLIYKLLLLLLQQASAWMIISDTVPLPTNHHVGIFHLFCFVIPTLTPDSFLFTLVQQKKAEAKIFCF